MSQLTMINRTKVKSLFSKAFHKMLTTIFPLIFSACALHSPSVQPNSVAVANAVQDSQLESCIVPIEKNKVESVLEHQSLTWDECFDHNAEGLFFEVISRIEQLIKVDDIESAELDSLLYSLRAFSYYADRKRINDKEWLKLHQMLIGLSQISGFSRQSESSQRIREHYLVSLYRFYYEKPLQSALAPHISSLVKMITQVNATKEKSLLSKQAQYTLWELYRTVGFLAYEARSKKEIKRALLDEANLTDNLLGHLDFIKHSGWQLDHALWVLANIYSISEENEQKRLDQQVKRQLFAKKLLTEVEKKQYFSQTYLANSFRYLDNCQDEFKDLCLIPTLEQVLPIKHICSDSLFIRATTMTEQQLNLSCQRLIGQEGFFHQRLATNLQPVANDNNQSLRVVIFDNYSDYNRYGQLVFNIGTNNGGMYIEGTPSNPKNQATFYSFQAFWQQPEFSVWNLNHEYVHYLDGRFTKYGSFGHFPSHVVWWTEGIAEYISKENNHPKAKNLLNKTPQDKWPTLAQIFSTTYADGSDRVYKWSYLAHLFLFEHYPELAPKLAYFLKTDYFEGYRSLLNTISLQKQAEFANWLTSIRPSAENSSSKEKRLRNKPSKLYRYLYRDYLQPPHLPVNEQHNHFSNHG